MDDEKKNIKVTPETSEKFTGLKTGKPKKTAAGLPAIISSIKHINNESGLFRGFKALNELNKHDGIDCPGCAWPDPDDDRSTLGEYCENGAKAIAEEATKKKLTPNFFRKYSVAELSQLSDYEIGKKGRIAQPMYLPKGANHYEEISWDNAFSLIANKLNGLASPDEAIFYTSGRTSNEAAFLYQLFVRKFGTNNLPDCSNMCHESSGVALGETLGIGKGSVKLEDFYDTDLILIMGQNPGTNHPRMLSALQKARRNGSKIVTVNPLKEAGLMAFNNPQEVRGLLGISTDLCDMYLQVRINGDMALLQAVMKILIEKEDSEKGSVFDHDFIKEKTEGFDYYISALREKNLADLVEICGIPEDKIRELAELITQNRKMIACWAMGLTQHKNAVDTIKEVVNLLLLKGSIGKPGAGTCPVRGHSNVQGDRTMGIFEQPPESLMKKMKERYGFEPPGETGYNTVESIEAMHKGQAKVFFAMGGNFMSATPDTLYTAEALQNCDLTVHVSTKLNRSHLVHGKEALILPCYGRTDKDIKNGELQIVSVENSMGVVHSSRGSLEPVSKKLLSEPDIVCRLAKATVGSNGIDWDSYLVHYDHIRDDIEFCINGFENYNERVRQFNGFYLPNGAREGDFHTDIGKARFTISHPIRHELAEAELMMMTIRSHDQFNTTIYGLDDRYRGIYNERRVVLMNKNDMDQLGIHQKDVVDLINSDAERERVAPNFIALEYDIPQKCVATYFPEANVLVPVKSIADKSHTPTSKSVVIRIRKRKGD